MSCEVCKVRHTIIQNSPGGPIELCAPHHRELAKLWLEYGELVTTFQVLSLRWRRAQHPSTSGLEEDLEDLFSSWVSAESTCHQLLEEWLNGRRVEP